MVSIKLEDVIKKYGSNEALSGVSFEIDDGELYGLLGNNGAGKTTTINILTGQIEPDSGEVTVLGTNPTENPVKTRKEVGILPEREEPPSLLTPREYFEFIGEVRGIDDEELERRMIEWSGRLDFAGELDTVCADLSRGQRQMVMITQAFLAQPSLIIIDEPLVNLDPSRQERVKDSLLQYRNRGNTILLSTHRLPFAEEICSKIGILHDGEIKSEVVLNELDSSLEQYFSDQTIPIPSIE